MKRKAGIFDPWRQLTTPAVDETPVRKISTEVHIDGATEQHCIQFNGIRAGVFVWLLGHGEDDSGRARAIIVDVVYRISAREGVAKILREWGVYPGEPKQPNPVVVVSGEKKMTISVPVADDRLVPRAIDNLSLALREVSQRFPDVRDTLSALKVHPYLK